MSFFQKIFWIFALFLIGGVSTFAKSPFEDVPASSSYFTAVEVLYENGIIQDDGSHLFRPDDTMRRDFYVSLVVGVGCKKCSTPTFEDIQKYSVSPYIDLPKSNPYFYCVAYADDEDIVKGYVLGTSGQTSCQNGNSYSSVPFCAENTTSRIEAAAILLRRANLWNETLNTNNTDFSLQISDVNTYWYGYAKKAIEVGLITQKNDGSIGQDEAITRGEFANMAWKILDFTQCNPIENTSSLDSKIVIEQNGNTVNKTDFQSNEACEILPKTTKNGNWKYQWTVTYQDRSTKNFSSESIGCDVLEDGTNFIEVKIIDPNTSETLSNPTLTVNTTQDNTPTDDATGLGVLLDADPLSGDTDTQFTFTTTISHTDGATQVTIDYGDNTSQTTKTQDDSTQSTHTYDTPGVYTVTVTVTDENTGNTGQSTVVVEVQEDDDTDDDGVPNDEDLCPKVRGSKANKGCPEVDTGNHGCKLRQQLGEDRDCESDENDDDTDTDGDGILDSDDTCPYIAGSVANNGCPEDDTSNGIDSEIFVTQDGSEVDNVEFDTDDSCTLAVQTTHSKNWKYQWTVTHQNGSVKNFNTDTISCNDLDDGTSDISVVVSDPDDDTEVANPSVTISIQDTSTTPTNGITNGIGVVLSGDPLSGTTDTVFTITTTISQTPNTVDTTMDFGDSTTESTTLAADESTLTTSHTYDTPGVYTVTVTATDTQTQDTGDSTLTLYVKNADDDTDTDGDGILDSDDTCPKIAGPKENNGCPIVSTSGDDNTYPNACLIAKSKQTGLIRGSAICDQCPCNNSLEISSLIRECDIVFPTILSPAPELSTVYSRGSFYLVQ